MAAGIARTDFNLKVTAFPAGIANIVFLYFKSNIFLNCWKPEWRNPFSVLEAMPDNCPLAIFFEAKNCAQIEIGIAN